MTHRSTTTSAKRLVVIGIDGMDAEYVAAHLNDLPHFRALAERGYGGAARSVFPTDSIPAWITIFTGIPPVEHGFLDAIDYFKKGKRELGIDVSVFKDRTFWDVASQAGRRCCVINPFLAWPPWDIDGIMVSGPVFVDEGSEAVTPAELARELELPKLGGIVEFPSKETLAAFCAETREYTLAQHRFSMEMLQGRGPWDLFFSTYLTMDRIQHFLWRYHDPEDPTHPGPTPFSATVHEFYQLFDGILGDYMDAVGDDMEIMVLADHGHGRRCTDVVNVNEILRRRGWLKTKAGNSNPVHPRRVLQRMKTSAMEALDRWDKTDLTHRIAKLLPGVRKLKKGGFLVDETENLVHTPYFAGTNPCGGVAISRERLEESEWDYDTLRSAVIEELSSLRDARTGERVFRWVAPREDVLGPGGALERYPDVLFLLESRYGTGWDLFGERIAVNPTHRKISGGHKLDGAFYTSFDPGRLPWSDERRYHLHDVAPLILHTLGLPLQPWMHVVQRGAAADADPSPSATVADPCD